MKQLIQYFIAIILWIVAIILWAAGVTFWLFGALLILHFVELIVIGYRTGRQFGWDKNTGAPLAHSIESLGINRLLELEV